MNEGLDQKGWLLLQSPGLSAWAQAAAKVVQDVVGRAGPDAWRHGSTWFAGVDALPSGSDGAVPGGPPLPWADLPLEPMPMHRAQVSVVRPGYPRADAGESAATLAYRQRRDAAHLDGLLPIGPNRRRMVREPHAWVLGIGLWGGATGAAPTVVWSGSHRVMRAALTAVLSSVPPESRADTDVTEAYTAARRTVFETCPRVELPLAPGQAVILHRHLLHGIAPWRDSVAAPQGRAVAWFRPLLADVGAWLG